MNDNKIKYSYYYDKEIENENDIKCDDKKNKIDFVIDDDRCQGNYEIEADGSYLFNDENSILNHNHIN